MTPRLAAIAILTLAALARPAIAADDRAEAPATGDEEATPAPWEFGISVNGYFLPDQASYVQPTVTVDHDFLHLEARYNYEARRTGSLWVGWNFSWGKDLVFTLTPMVGGVFGDLNGMAPGVEWDLSWGPLELYSESEYVLDFAGSSGNYFYSWSELSVWPFEWLRAGIALQRTRAVESSRLAQWGPLLGLQIWKLTAAAYWFEPGQADAYWVASLGASF
jgi:hypothetical protein